MTPQYCATTPMRLGNAPRHCSTYSLSKTTPTTIRHCAERPASTLWHCAAYFRTANTSSPRRGTAEPSKGDEYFSCVYTGLHRNVRPAGTVFSVTISPVRPSPPLQHHSGHCSAIPHAVKVHRDGTSPRPPLCLVRPTVNSTLELASRQQPDKHPLRHHPRSCPCTGTELATTSQQEQDSPRRS
jgi:hypothetical protein